MPRAGRPVRQRLSDAKLTLLAQQYDSLTTKGKRLMKFAEKRKTAIIEELERRGTTGIFHSGIKITKVENETVVYDPEYLEENLTARQWRMIAPRKLDSALLSQAVQNGDIDPEVVEAAAHVKTSAPYIRVSQK